MNSGIYIRVGKENLLLEQMPKEEREEWLSEFDDEGLKRIIEILCDTLWMIEVKFNLFDEE